MAKMKDKYCEIVLQDITRGRVRMCNDCGSLVGVKELHNKICLIVREGQIND